MTSPRIVLATIGTLGDLHPFIAIGLALRERGVEAVLAVPEDHLPKCRAAGLEAHAIMPRFEEVGRAIGLPDDEIVRRVVSDNDFLLRRVILPSTGDGVARLVELARGADAVVGSAVAPAAGIAAERLRLPFVHVLLQPFLWFNPHDPPRGPSFRLLKGAPVGRAARAWNAVLLAAIRAELRRRFGGELNRVRRENGLPSSRAAPMVDAGPWVARELGVYSPLLGGAPARATVTGYPWFDRDEDGTAALDAELAAFLDAGRPPLIVSLGSFIPYSDTDLYRRAADLAGRLGLRAVLLTGESQAEPSRDVLVRPYAPHSLLFPRAAAVVHHGGIGTTGQALRSGRPQLVTPFMGDQFDNAARVERLGVGLQVAPKRFAARAPGLVRRLLDDAGVASRAAAVGAQVSAEDGAGAAAEAILRVAADQSRASAFSR
ncbi:glycosyltransferase [Sphingomonas lenta]|nr:nucleotide disphospho-sugar-binding domain-containing protein [Sphingomonas lenta]